MSMRLQPASRGGDQVAVLEGLGVAIDDRVLLTDFSATIRRGDVIGLIGPNGTGKSTLLSVLLGTKAANTGASKIGDSIQLGYYAQDLGDVPKDQELFDIIHDLRPSWNRGQVQDHLGRFGFSGDSVRRKPESLSGGERARVALARLMLNNANFLIFDEPTNHLDVETIEALEDAIDQFEGTVLLVSHDRALLRSLTNRIWALDNATIEDFSGGYDDWAAARLAKRRAEAERIQAAKDADRKKSNQRSAPAPSGPRPLTAAKRALAESEARVEQLEADVAERGRTLEQLTRQNSAEGARRAGELKKALQQAKTALEAAIGQWEKASAEVDRLSTQDD